MFQIPAVRGTENSRNSVPNHSEEEKNARKSIQWIKKRSKLSDLIPNHFAEDKTTRNSVPWNKNRSKLSEFCYRYQAFCSYFGHFIKQLFSRNSVRLQLELTLPWTSECLGMCTFFLGITEIVPSLQYFPECFSECNSVPNLSSVADPGCL